MQIMFGTILYVLLKSLILTKATITPKDDNTSNILQEESISMYQDINFTQNISMSEKNYHRILNFKSDRSHSDSTVRNEREVDEVTLANISIIPESIENSLNKPTSLRAFVQFDSQFTEKVNDIFVTLRWKQPEFTDEIIQGYTVQCFVMEDLKEIQICDDKNITTLEHTVHNLKPNTTYYFRVRAHTEVIAGLYTDFINVSTTHENPIPKLLLVTDAGIQILDLDSNTINNLVKQLAISDVAYCVQEHKIYWITGNDLMTLEITENNITKIASFHKLDHKLYYLSFDWVARNLYMSYQGPVRSFIVKFDLTMWENGIIKFENILGNMNEIYNLNILPSMGYVYYRSPKKIILH
ncbi:proto-oncogene tyrosine-protein kinase ROS-like [Camponotus floridanus]|uniref:proto-oncogene tyrosine-protein kinase ROS-like n=1 Tax=Camponotus floridanus TaxID=104421 RepID=UPI000DC6CA5C|nr:proto-oncogene tyrosine-protein kinase ROS-like [Camponotus floridanus]